MDEKVFSLMEKMYAEILNLKEGQGNLEQGQRKLEEGYRSLEQGQKNKEHLEVINHKEAIDYVDDIVSKNLNDFTNIIVEAVNRSLDMYLYMV